MLERLKIAGGSIVAFSALVGLAAYRGPEAAAAQMRRQVEFPIVNRMPPVVITKVTLGSVAVQAGRFVRPANTPPDPITPFLADDDWVQNLTVYLLNRTNQTIVYADFTFSFPETTDWASRFRAGSGLVLGRIPQSAAFGDDGRPIHQPPEAQPILFRPGETMAIHLGDHIDRIKADVEPTRPLAALTAIEVRLVGVFFADGLRWGPRYMTLDPRSHTWRTMGPDYFPGDMNRNYPGQPGWGDGRR